MDKEQQKQIQWIAQEYLEQLQGSDASFLFVGNDGNCFTMGGIPSHIEAQIIFAMIRYPFVEKIIKSCADNFEKLKNEFGEDVKIVKMKHIIEKYSKNN